MNVKSFLGNIAKAYLVIGALSASAFVSADNYNGQPNVGCGAPCGVSCAPACNEPPHCGWGYNPPAYIRCGNGCNNFVDTLGFRVDFLYWRPSEDQLALGIEQSYSPITTGSTGAVVADTTYTKKPKYQFDAGFRLGLTHFCPCDCWDVALNWTYFHSKASVRGASVLPSGYVGGAAPTVPYTIFVPFWERVAGLYPDLAEGHWTLDMNLIDLEFGHKYYVSSCFVLRPHLGLRAGRINQTFRVESSASHSAVASGILGPIVAYTAVAEAKNDFLAIGPRVGLDLELDLGCGFSIVGQAAGSILFGSPKLHGSEDISGAIYTGTPVSPALLPSAYEAKGTHGSISRTISDLAFGVKWDHCLNWCNQSHPVSLAILWEHHGFYDFNEFRFGSNGYNALGTPTIPLGTAAAGKPNGDFYTQGLTVALNFGF